MTSLDNRVRPNPTDVAAKVIDGEAIIMNLSNGLYFSMENVGATIWELAEDGHTLEEMAEALVGRYGIDRETAETDVVRLVNDLLAENLVEIAGHGSNGASASSNGSPAGTYARPVLNKYSDMADLLALDPPMPGLGEIPE